MEGTSARAQEGIEPSTDGHTSATHACGLKLPSSSQINGHIQSILSADPGMENHENSMLENHENSMLRDADLLHQNGRAIDQNIWSLLSDSPLTSTPVFATHALATKSKITFNDHVEISWLLKYKSMMAPCSDKLQFCLYTQP